MIYLIGGAPRTGKSILGQQFAANQKISWISTDLLVELLRVKGDEGVKTEWDAAPQAIETNAEWFYPYLERFIWGISAQIDGYVIEGVDFLPKQVAQLAAAYRVRTVFLGRSQMTIGQFDRFPGKSPGYAKLPGEMRLRIVRDVPPWSEYVQREAIQYGYPYLDIADGFKSRIAEAEAVLNG
jgi:2-phosphoglycerate kinase